MRILFLGDVVGRSGRDAIAKHLPELKARLKPEVIIVNAENAAGGFGVTEKIAQDFYGMGVDCLTTGNHVWDQRELLGTIDQDLRLLRPLNYPEGTPGRGSYTHTLNDGRKIIILNVMARLFMEPVLDDPFALTEKFIAQNRLGHIAKAIFIDFHAEATSEKMAYAHVFDGRVSAVVGTHTHVPTADEQILPKGTAYMTDAGMCGDYDSVVGMKKDLAIWRFTRKTPGERKSPADGEATVCGTFIVTNDATGLAQSIVPVRIGGRLRPQLS
jgi:metallophosphoesterase (TIGR00282 family)